ncbi:stage V sporulation protein AB [Paenibacillus sp. GCM10023248]|uniref:stage V sporulation protein AB n=1 Tax=Bacillales TaxID=1385 RepID=UPI00237892CC|nr:MULTISPECIES: stage V sporulation protein AB [Bacillales]MDD9267576.1 stage V sporulation protein AB [Paenibacillus sp. MAHUQ-63]MDR6882794.1 stage V sporulation protein AB [Bacillus sp. 3255]
MAPVGEMLLIAFVGLAGGIAVGSGMVAFLVVLDIIPRLAQITRSFSKIHAYEGAVVIGSLVFTWVDFSDWRMRLFPAGTALVGLFAGCFVGMLAAALTEIINVLPILAKRVGMGSYMILLLMAMIFGKVIGSLFEWLFY